MANKKNNIDYFLIETEVEAPLSCQPEKNFITAIIQLALFDIFYQDASADPWTRSETIEWINSDERHDLSFLYYCDLLKYSDKDIANIRRIVKNNNINNEIDRNFFRRFNC